MKLYYSVCTGLVLLSLLLLGFSAKAESLAIGNHPLAFTILSSQTLSGTAGDYVAVDAQVKNTGSGALRGITTYLSLVDTDNKLPVDLEDWSAEKGRYIGIIETGQTLPLSWKIHFVKAGAYDLAIVADIQGNATPEISGITHFAVKPKRNLNPGHVLPVALITPLVLVFIFFLLNYRRGHSP